MFTLIVIVAPQKCCTNLPFHLHHMRMPNSMTYFLIANGYNLYTTKFTLLGVQFDKFSNCIRLYIFHYNKNTELFHHP